MRSYGDELQIGPGTIMLDQETLEATIGFGGTMSDGVLKISVPRNDLKVTVDAHLATVFRTCPERSDTGTT